MLDRSRFQAGELPLTANSRLLLPVKTSLDSFQADGANASDQQEHRGWFRNGGGHADASAIDWNISGESIQKIAEGDGEGTRGCGKRRVVHHDPDLVPRLHLAGDEPR